MVFFEFVSTFLTSILIGYLAFTNTLADKIENLFPVRESPEITQTIPENVSSDSLEKIPTLSDSTPRLSIPKILLEHQGYQRAALAASKRDDSSLFDTSDLPLDTAVMNALVNVYCQYKTDKYIRTTTGSGFFINPKGVILTNAHVAQFLLLKNSKGSVADVRCVIRTGNPAKTTYEAELLYISPTWIFDNADLITDESPRGTGERDYALLYVSKSTNSTPLPTRFPAIPADVALLSKQMTGTPVLTAGYPAELLLRKGADALLTPVVASTTLGNLYTFGSNYADIFSISESPVGEQGASGGPIVTVGDRSVIGLIVTKGDENTEGPHSLRALTLSYIDRTITEETGFSLLQNMQGDVAYRGDIFKKAMVPFLAGILEEELVAHGD